MEDKRVFNSKGYLEMIYSFIRFLFLFFLFIGGCIYSARIAVGDHYWVSILVVFVIVVPITSYAWSALVRKCYTEEVKRKSPFLYALGMIFWSPQKVFGAVFSLVGAVWVCRYLMGSVHVPLLISIFSLGMLILGLSWLINVVFAAREGVNQQEKED